MSSNNEDDNHGILWLAIFGALIVALGTVFGVALHKAGAAHKGGVAAAGKLAGAAAAGAAVAGAADAGDAASIKVENGIVKFYFATGKADMPTGAKEALGEVLSAVGAGKRLQISGYHDATGDQATNEELSKKRAFAVRDTLKAYGVTDDKLELKKPENSQASGTNAEARRVEVSILP